MALFHHRIVGTTPGESWSLGVYTTGEGTLAAAQTTWGDAVAALWTGALDSVITADVHVVETTTASIASASGTQISRLSDDVSLSGVAAGEMLPYQCASAVSWRSDLATRAGRGRIYLPPLAASVLDAGRLSAGAVTTIVGAVEDFWGALNTGGLQLVLYSRTAFTTQVVTKADVGNVIDTQRRRRNKLIEQRSPVTPPA